MRLLKSFFLGSVIATNVDDCFTCEYAGVASSLDNAIKMLSGTDSAGAALIGVDLNPCLHGRTAGDSFANALLNKEIKVVKSAEESTATNCIAKFFLYEARDIASRWVYGVERTYGSSITSPGSQVDVERFEGIKAWTLSKPIAATNGDVTKYSDALKAGVVCSNSAADGACSNPRFVRRGVKPIVTSGAKHTVNNAAVAYTTDNVQAFAMDGREAAPSDWETRATNKNPTATTPQQSAMTLCLVCNGLQEFSNQPTQSSQITDACWNPSSSSTFKTDDITARNPNYFCQPVNGQCTTETFQYATKNDIQTTSYWVGIKRGCPAKTDGDLKPTHDGTGAAHGLKIGATGMTKFTRTYLATNSAAKAKDNAKYPDAGTSLSTTASTAPLAFGEKTEKKYKAPGALINKVTDKDDIFWMYGYIDDGAQNAADTLPLVSRLKPQFMSVDGSGPPDLPKLVDPVSEIECLSCSTPLSNTNSENTCVNAKTTQTVKCKTLLCAAVTSAYKLDAADTSETFYYAKRGCAADPLDGIDTGEQAQADSFVFPAGYTDIKQSNQRTTTAKGNTLRTSTVSTANVFDCYSCDVTIHAEKVGSNPAEPLFDEVKDQDTGLCWQTFEPQTDTAVAATGTSGRCETKCYVKAYKYKETTGSVAAPVTTFHWFLERGCAQKDEDIETGSSPSTSLFGVSVSNYVCDYTNGTLCNSKLENYDTNLQLKTQTIRKLQCYTCETPAGNTDVTDSCYTIPSTEKAAECPDLSYTSCFATQTSYNTSATTSVFGMKRGCSKEAPGSSEAEVEGFSNVMSSTTVCASSSCNKAVGASSGLVLGTASASDNDVIVDVEEDESSASLVISSILLLFGAFALQ